jgi:hypothetical protein
MKATLNEIIDILNEDIANNKTTNFPDSFKKGIAYGLELAKRRIISTEQEKRKKV